MPAKNLRRVSARGIYCHIYNSGIENRTIFNDEEDYEVFLGFLNDYLSPSKDPKTVKKEFVIKGQIFHGTPHQPKNYFGQVELIAYGLTPYSFDLLLHQASEGSIEKLLRSLCTRYSIYFNKKYHHSGTLFAGPYKSSTVEKKDLPSLSGKLHHAKNHSSYPEYIGLKETNWLKPEAVLGSIDKRTNYKVFFEQYVVREITPLERSEPTLERSTPETVSEPLEKSHPNEESEPLVRSNPPSNTQTWFGEFVIVSITLFVLLMVLGIRSVASFRTAQNPQNNVLAESKAIIPDTSASTPAPTEVPITPKTASVKLADPTAKVVIRLQPDVKSKRIDYARNGQVFELLSSDSDWFQVKLASGSAAFISAKYMEELP